MQHRKELSMQATLIDNARDTGQKSLAAGIGNFFLTKEWSQRQLKLGFGSLH